MAEDEDMPADRILDDAKRIAEHLLDVQRHVNEQMDATQSELLPGVRQQLGLADAEPVDLSDLTNLRIAGLSIVLSQAWR
jgi:3-deoxy-7-phosphoheptulonate synthase